MKNLLKWISISDRFSKMYLDRHLAPWGISSSQHFYILLICDNPGLTQDKLMGMVTVNPSNITRALAQLERTGFIQRRASQRDKRTFHLEPTEKALEVYPEILKIQNEWKQILTLGMTPEEQVLLETLLSRVGTRAINYFSEHSESLSDSENHQ